MNKTSEYILPIPESFAVRMRDGGDLCHEFKSFIHNKLFRLIPGYINGCVKDDPVTMIGKMENTCVSNVIGLWEVSIDTLELIDILADIKNTAGSLNALLKLKEFVERTGKFKNLIKYPTIFNKFDFERIKKMRAYQYYATTLKSDPEYLYTLKSILFPHHRFLLMFKVVEYIVNEDEYFSGEITSEENVYAGNNWNRVIECVETKNRFIAIPIQFKMLYGGHVIAVVIDMQNKLFYFFDSNKVSDRIRRMGMAREQWIPDQLIEKFSDFRNSFVGESLCLNQPLFQMISNNEFCQTWTLFNTMLIILNTETIDETVKKIIFSAQPVTVPVENRDTPLGKQTALTQILLEFMFWLYRTNKNDIDEYYRKICNPSENELRDSARNLMNTDGNYDDVISAAYLGKATEMAQEKCISALGRFGYSEESYLEITKKMPLDLKYGNMHLGDYLKFLLQK